MFKRTMPTRTMSAVRVVALGFAAAPVLSGCGLFGFNLGMPVKFSEAKYGAASPRVTYSRDVPKGGGRYMVGKPYEVAGRWYTPRNDPSYDKVGTASWYGPNFHGRKTANGEVFDQYALTAASPTLPLPSYVRVTNMDNGRSLIVRVNDRGPYVHGRIIDLSGRAAGMLGYLNQGTAKVRVQYVGPAPLEGDDTRILMASYNAASPLEKRGSRTLLAFNNTSQAPQPQAAPLVAPIPAAATLRRLATGSSQPVSLLSYAAGDGSSGDDAQDKMIHGAIAAASAMASRDKGLEQWRDSIDLSARKVDVSLGVFTNTQSATRLAGAFALLGAVEQDSVTVEGRDATLLRLTYLRPGVTREDVLDLARRQGLQDVSFTR